MPDRQAQIRNLIEQEQQPKKRSTADIIRKEVEGEGLAFKPQAEEEFVQNLRAADPDFVAAQAGQAEIEAESPGIGTRFLMGTKGDFENKVKALRVNYPEGDLRILKRRQFIHDTRPTPGEFHPSMLFPTDPSLRLRVVDPQEAKELMDKGERVLRGPVEDVLAWRPDQASPFKIVNPQTIGDVPADLAEFISQDLGAIVAEGLVTARMRGANLLTKLFVHPTAAATGEALQQEALTALDIPREAREGEQATISAVATLLSKPAEKVADIFRGKGLLNLNPEELEAIKAIERTTDELPTPGMISSHPIIQRLESQPAMVDPKVRARREATGRKVVEHIKLRANPEEKAQFVSTLARVQDLQEKDFINNLRKELKVPKAQRSKFREAGIKLQIGAREASEEMRVRVNHAFEVARDIEEPIIDATPIKLKAQEILSGQPLLLDDGSLVNIAELPGSVRKLIENVAKISPDGNSVQALRDVNSQLFKERMRLNQAASGKFTTDQKAILSLENEVRGALYNIKNSSPQMIRAYTEAAKLHKNRMDFLEDQITISIMDSSTPGELARNYFQPGNHDKLFKLRRNFPNDKFEAAQSAWKFSMLEEAGKGNLGTIIDSYDSETLNLIISKADQRKLSRAAREWDNINRLDFRRIAEENQNARFAARELINSAKPADIQRLKNFIKSSDNSAAERKRIASGVLDWFYEQSLFMDKGRVVVGASQYHSNIKKLEDLGLMDILSSEEQRFIKDINKFVDFISPDSDFGSSLQAAETVAQFRSLTRFEGGTPWKNALAKIVNVVGWGRLITSDRGKKLLLGSIHDQIEPIDFISTHAGNVSKLVIDIDEDMKELERQQEEFLRGQ